MPGGVNLGNAYGQVIIDGAGAVTGINSVQQGLLGLQGGLTGVNPAVAVLGLGLLGVATVAGGFAAAIGTSTSKAADLEAQLDAVQAISGATDAEMSQLRDTIDQLALDPDLKVSAFEAADAMEKLAGNGLAVADIVNGAAEATVLLANATGAEFGPAATTATDVMAIFGIRAEEMTGAVNGITSVVNASKFEFGDYQLALAQAGGVAASVGVEFDDFNTSIAGISSLFASGSDAGTSYKTFLQRLIPASTDAAEQMKKLGIITADGRNQFFDANGQLKDMADIAGILDTSLSGLSEEQRNNALSTIFGTDAMRAAVGLANLGEKGFSDLQATMAKTSAADAAATRMGNLKGALEILSGVVESVQLQVGDKFIPLWTMLAQKAAGFLSGNADQIVAFFGGIADGAMVGADAISRFLAVLSDPAAANVSGFGGMDPIVNFLLEARNSLNSGGVEGLLALLVAKLQSGWTGTVLPAIGGWGTDIWAWIGQAYANLPANLSLLVNGLAESLKTGGPQIRATTREWAGAIWEWVSDGAARASQALAALLIAILAWASSAEGGAALTNMGSALGENLVGGLSTALGDTGKAGMILLNLVMAIAAAAVAVGVTLVAVGGQLVAGLFEGVINAITGGNYQAWTIAELTAFGQQLLATDWGAVGAGLSDQLAAGLANGAAAIGQAVGELLAQLNPLQNIQLPDIGAQIAEWTGAAQSFDPGEQLTANSPTPFEMGLRGISDAISGMPDIGQALAVSPSTADLAAITTPAATAGGGGTTVNNTLGNVTLNINGAGDPAAVGREVKRQIEGLFNRSAVGAIG